MITRQKLLLHLLKQAGGKTTRLHLVKLAFLLSQRKNPRQGKEKLYQFVPYKYGPFSFSLYHDLDNLISEGYIISPNDQELQLAVSNNDKNIELDYLISQDIKSVINSYGYLQLDDLIDLVYELYPWYTLNSEKISRRSVHLPSATQAIYTAGYEGWQIDGFLNHLLLNGIRVIIDVRNNPVSRVYGYHKSTLAKLSNNVGINYFHFPQLGIISELRSNLVTYSDYLLLFDKYQRQLEKQVQAIVEVSRILTSDPAILVCKESDPKFCHRSRLASNISESTSLPIINL